MVRIIQTLGKIIQGGCRNIKSSKAAAQRGTKLCVCLVFLLSIVVPSLFWPVQKADAATIALRATGATNVADAASSISLTVPTGVLEGDLMVAFIGQASNQTPSSNPAGWTRHTICVSGTTTETMIYYKRAGVSESGTAYSFNLGAAAVYGAGGIVVYSGANASSVDATGTCNAGAASTTLNPGDITTVAANALVVAGYSQRTTNGATNTIRTNANGTLSERMFAQSAVCTGIGCLTNVNASSFNGSDFTQATAGTVTGTTKNATSTQSVAYAAVMVSFKPADTTFSMSAYRWFANMDSADFIAVASNPTTGEDKATATALDAANGYIYLAGYDAGGATTTPQWRVEKRKTTSGELCTATVCGTQFGTAGVITEDVASSTDEKINAIAIDASGGFMYLAGHDSAGSASKRQWRIEKRSLSTGALVTAFDTDGILTEDTSGGGTDADDDLYAIAIDVSGGNMYLGGSGGLSSTNSNLRIEKRSLTSGALVTAFDTDGIITEELSGSKPDGVTSIVLDTAGGVAYFGGFDGTPGGAASNLWRVEKRSMTTGAVGTGFGNGVTACTAFATDGVYCADVNRGNTDDRVTSLYRDSTYLFITGNDTTSGGQWRVDRITLSSNTITASLVINNVGSSSLETIENIYSDGTNIFLSGFDSAGASSSRQWRYEKRTVAGALVTAFDTDGILTVDPTSGGDEITAAEVDTSGGYIYGVGFDSTGGIQWRMDRRSTTSGASAYNNAIAAQDTKASAGVNRVVRLRLLLHIGTYNLYPGANEQLKLQAAPKSGTCDTGFVGETANFFDITTATSGIRYYDNPGAVNGAASSTVIGDPTHGADVKVVQSYLESNNFTNSAVVTTAQDGVWDFALIEDGSLSFGAYCFRVLKSDGSAILTPTSSVPELVYCGRPITSVRLRQAKYFCDEARQPFYWVAP